MKSYRPENKNTLGYLEQNPLPPEPPIWLGVCLAALIGAVFIGAIIALHYFTR
jgi:hypothetical protein